MSETVERWQAAWVESRNASRDLIVEVETLAAQVATLRAGNAELMRQRDEARANGDETRARLDQLLAAADEGLECLKDCADADGDVGYWNDGGLGRITCNALRDAIAAARAQS